MKIEQIKLANRIAINLYKSVVTENYGVFSNEEAVVVMDIMKSMYPDFKELNKTLTSNIEEVLRYDKIGFSSINQLLAYIYPEATSIIIEERVSKLYNDANQVNLSNITVDMFETKLRGLLMSNTAIDSSIAVYIIDYLTMGDVIDINDILVKEVKYGYMGKTGIVPKDSEEFLVYIMYIATGTAMLIKDNDTLNKLTMVAETVIDIFINYTTEVEKGIEKLASLFYRHKKIFIAIKIGLNKYNKEGKHFINVIRRKAGKYHKPVNTPKYQRLLSEQFDRMEILEILLELDSPYLIKLLKGATYRMYAIDINVKEARYQIRNGLSYIDTFSTNLSRNDYRYIRSTIVEILSQRMYSNILKHHIAFTNTSDAYIDLGIPVNNKKMVGNFPNGTKLVFKSNQDVMFGIYWTELNKNYTRSVDLDLSLVSKDVKIGWNGDNISDDKNIIYSGDVISAPNGASEIIHIDYVPQDESYDINVNNYTNSDDVEYTFSIANTSIDKENFNKDYYIHPDEILTSIPLTFPKDVQGMKIGTLQREGTYTMLTINNIGQRSNVSKQLSTIEEAVNSIETLSLPTLSKIVDISIFQPDTTTKVTIDIANPTYDQLMLLLENNED